MQGRPLAVAWREPDTPEALKAAYQREGDPEVRTRPVAAPLGVAFGDGSPGEGHPLSVSTALGGLVSPGRLTPGAAAPDGWQGAKAMAKS